MNDQYPASPTPGQPDRRKPQRSAWNGGEKSSGSFGKSGGQSSGNPFSSPESNSGPFSSGGTTSLFHSGLKQTKSAWGTPVPDVQGAASQGAAAGQAGHPVASGYSGQSGYNPYAASGSSGGDTGLSAGYKNLRRLRPSAGSRFAVTLVIIVVSMVISFAAGLISFFSDDDDPAPVPIPTFSAPAPLPSIDDVPTANPNNGQNTDGSVTVGVWRVEKVEFLPDASGRLANVSELPELEPGFRFAALKMRFTNEGDVARSPAYDVGVTVYYGDGGGDRSWEEMTIREADSVRGLDDIAPGASVEGWYYVQVPQNYTGGKLAFFDYDAAENVESDLMLP